LFQNYGVAIIVFSILLKIVLLPISIKQQKTMKKSQLVQGKTKEIQEKYKGNQEKINTEMMAMYKEMKMSSFSGCLSSILQIVLLISIFLIISRPLTFMKKTDAQVIENYKNEVVTKYTEEGKRTTYPEILIIKEKGLEDNRVFINMNFLELDLNSVPNEKLTDWTVYIIPILYVASSFVSMKITSNMTGTKKKTGELNEVDSMMQMNKNMMWMMPIMSITISIFAPLGLALYWLVNNLLMIIERVILNKFIIKDEEKEV
jgi:YidC/Oxa1 family membrane protein insertase